METVISNKGIMLIDDDAVTNMINSKIIKMNSSYDVHEYSNAEVALAQLRHWCTALPEKLPSLIFLDINMPIMDGWEFLEEFQKLPTPVLEKSKICMLTSSIDVEDIERAKAYPMVGDFVSKPLTSEKLIQLIHA